MYKISWNKKSDKFYEMFVIVPNVDALYEAWWIITGYGREDGAKPGQVTVTNLDGEEIDMSKGKADAACYGTYVRI